MNAYERYQTWLNSENVSEATKEELRTIQSNNRNNNMSGQIDQFENNGLVGKAYNSTGTGTLVIE